MNYKRIYEISCDVMYRACDMVHTVKYYLPYFEKYRILLKSNRDFKNCMSEKRCFIIGNGPSLKEQNLTVLKNELVITTNKGMLLEEYKTVNSNYHIWGDERYFVDENVELMKRINTDTNAPVCFFPWYKLEFVKKHSLDKILNIRYLPDGDLPYSGYNRKIDFSKHYFNSYNVVFTAISFAIYCGAKQIYLLGCDSTSIISYVENKLNENISGYAYEISEDERVRIAHMPLESNEEIFLHQAEVFRAFRILLQYCRKRGVELINCSAKSILDELPYKKFEEVITGNDKF